MESKGEGSTLRWLFKWNSCNSDKI